MTGPWNTPRGLIVLSLVLVCSLVAGAACVRHAAHDPVTQAVTTWRPGTADNRLTGLPPLLPHGSRHLTPTTGARQSDAAHLALLPAPHGSAAVGDPQQFGHRPAGSRSPPPV
ncbi:hypothetical protein E1295_21485 [Nonomuraea mesophila]|uniref:Uncharacterized protein n=1 Tax=Nonomuraea mesophila TaxID=2530382 RepID=A0A4R5FE95_9ACTN|nr:hypothetical protein [Nonomuraea mesophila]TDE48444.1 hypothetical protein E1295_21485 [Nonomuraea mesophila]